jgi:muramidase (phage lysozyme)
MNIRNRFAFLQMISVSEGTFGHGDNGYNVVVGGEIFHDYSTHPNIKVDLPRLHIKSTAAGRYQIIYRFWVAYQVQLHLPDFSPASQDKIALQLITECHALDDVDAGRFADAVDKCKSRWASLPGANYGQHENALDKLQLAYTNAGGALA